MGFVSKLAQLFRRVPAPEFELPDRSALTLTGSGLAHQVVPPATARGPARWRPSLVFLVELVSFLRRRISTCRRDPAPEARRASAASGHGKPRPFGCGLSASSIG